MIIKKINIINFGGLKNKEVDFNQGLNIIYGENEAGKSTIEAFIKIWLYGFSNYKGKDYKLNERMKYYPASGEGISGELYVEFEDKEYIIRRTFGKSKKDDTSVIINAISGEEVNYISKDEPGRYFLNINRSTFINTLFISQLGVSVKKDKEEEIIEKISNSIGSEDGQVSIDIAFLKLDKYKKSLSNVRKNGKLDLLNDRYSNLLSERYEAYKLSHHNLENEEKLINLNEEKENLNKEINNLEIYKRYLKKIKLQKEYKKITEYFQRKQELKSKKNSIDELLTFNNETISYRYLDDIKDEYSKYIDLFNLSNDEKEKIEIKEEKIRVLKSPIEKYSYVEQLPEDILSILEGLKIKKEVLEEKVNINRSIQNEITFLELKEKEAKKLIGKALDVSKFRREIGNLLSQYEEKLKELKYLVEEDNIDKGNNNLFNILLLGSSIVSIILGVIIKNKMLSSILYIIFAISLGVLFINLYLKKSGKTYDKKIEDIKSKINKVENELDHYCNKLGINDYSDLVKSVKIYDDYIKLHEKINEKINEKISQKQLLSIDKALVEYNKINEEINEYLNISKLDSLEMLIKDMKKYKEASKNFISLEIEVKNLKNNLSKTKEQLLIREERLRKSLDSIGFKDVDLLKTEDILNELQEKLELRDNINKSLASVEEAYSALTKGKDIELIKDELSHVININFKYSYENEEQIDDVVRSRNLKLLEVEKEIKDIENEIKNRFIGKRTIPTIEEEIKEVEYNIKVDEKNLKAVKIASEVLNEAYEEIRSSFGPILNKNVISSFENFTNGKYKGVMVSDNYEIKVKDNNNIMQADILSNGTNDQLYLSLRLAFIEMIFKNKKASIYLDDAFVQYDDKRTENTIKYLIAQKFKQYIIFTCQNREENILKENNIKHNYIKL